MTTLFVYGTLRTGETHWLTYLSPAIGESGATEPCFTMRDLGRYPAVESSGSTKIVGEVFYVDDQTLQRIDALEQHPDWYERIQIPITLSHGAIQEAWIYLMPHGQYDNMPCIDSGDWSLR
ncbi:MAG: gamma-glutamylcyclotransferase [Phycisphaerales bacterium]|nr:gamma-glutamylcyclotransferase [Phycisphaerales bacterium]